MRFSFGAGPLLSVLLLACGSGGGPLPGQNPGALPGGGGGQAGLDAGSRAPGADAGAGGSGLDGGNAGGQADAGLAGGPGDAGTPGGAGGGGSPTAWVTAGIEDFESVSLGAPAWHPDPVPDDGPFADHGAYFRARGVTPPAAFRISSPFGAAGWLTVESYTRSGGAPFASFAAVVADPANPQNHVLRIASPAHTDATVVRPTQALPPRYRVSLRVGFADFGDGRPGLNGYRGGETAEPWSNDDATRQNGFYWLTILDALPRPHNNTWIHHHRKVVIDSDNNFPPWTEVFDGKQFIPSGEHPVMMFALDGAGAGTVGAGKPFLSWSGGAFQPSGKIRAVDSYLSGEWYRVSIERDQGRFTMEVSGRFKYGGVTTYHSSIALAANCIWHFNPSPGEAPSRCIDDGHYPQVGPEYPNWPASRGWPDYFMFGDPHTNYYRGEVYYDDVRLEVPR